MSKREPMTDAALQQFLDDFIDGLAMPSKDRQPDDEGPADGPVDTGSDAEAP